MARLLLVLIAMSFSCGIGYAQSTLNTPAIGATSPLGIPGSTSPGSSTGIPLGATEINPGGISPMPLGSTANSSNCIGTGTSFSGGAASQMTGSPTAGASSTFDGGGSTGMTSGTLTSGTATTSGACASASPGTMSSTGIASPLSTPGTNVGSSLNGTIPLGATEVDSAGVSPMIGVPAPDSTSTPCAGSGVAATSGLATGTSGSTGLAAGSTSTSLPLGSAGTTGVGSSFGC